MPTSSQAAAPPLKEQLARESAAMVRHLLTNGTRVPAQLVQSAEQFESAMHQSQPVDIVALASTHERLSRLVAPAKPGTLALLDGPRSGDPQSSLGPVKVVRDLARVAMVCVAVFIVLSVIALVDAHRAVDFWGVEGPEPAPPAGQPPSDNHTVLIIKIILERVFWLAAAGIGASFAMLFQLNDQIVTRTFDPDENASYWVKFFLGLVAGFILVALVPINSGGSQDATTGAQALLPPTIALLGGFSASAVYRILTRMVEALESIFSGGAREQSAAAEKAAASRAAEESSQARMAVAGQLVEIQQRLAAGLSPDEAAAQLRQVVAGLVPSSVDAPAPSQAPTPPAPAPAPAPPADKVAVPSVVAAPEEASAQVAAGQPDTPVPAEDGITAPAAG